MKAKFQRLAKIFGLLFVMAGIVLPGMELFDAATATPATAQIVKFGRTCEKRICEIGKCRWQRFKCQEEAALITEGTKVRRKRHAKLSFGNGTEPMTAWASFSKLKLRRSTKIGDSIPILYRGPAPYYVSLRPSFSNVGTGINCALFGLFLLYVGGQLGRTAPSVRGPGQARPHSNPGASPAGYPADTPAATAATRPTLIPNPFASRPDRAPAYTSKPRQNVVQRNKSWF